MIDGGSSFAMPDGGTTFLWPEKDWPMINADQGWGGD